MVTPDHYPFSHHPCYSESRLDLWSRIHLPIARYCNVKCDFCDHTGVTACHTSKPGFAANLMEPAEAISRTIRELEKDSRLKIVAISGPGEPLANEETFETLRLVQIEFPNTIKCLSTNGLLLPEKIDLLHKYGVGNLTVTLNAIDPEIGAKIYEFVKGRVLGAFTQFLKTTDEYLG